MAFRSSTLETIRQREAALVSRYRRSQLGAVAVGEVLFVRDWALECDDIGTSYFVHLPMSVEAALARLVGDHASSGARHGHPAAPGTLLNACVRQ